MRPRCPDCHRVHPTDLATAIGRFNPTGPTGYRAHHRSAPTRRTRAEAEHDACQHHLHLDTHPTPS